MVAGVVGEAGHGRVRELLGLDEVAAAQLDRVDARDLGQAVHGPLDGVGRLGPAGAAVGVGGRHGGEHARAAERVGLGQVVHAGVEERPEQRDAGRDELQVARPCRRCSSTRTAVSWPSASAASSMSWIWPRPWMVACAFSVRSSTQRTGARCSRARATHSSSSAYTSSFEPKPPPTDGATTRSWCSGMPSVSATITFRMWGIWVARVERQVAAERLGHRGARPRLHRPSGCRRCWT